jgi:hypothetical protein
MFKIEQRLYAPAELIVKNGGPFAVSMSSIYCGIRDGSIPTVVVGHRKLVPYWYIKKLLRNTDALACY